MRDHLRLAAPILALGVLVATCEMHDHVLTDSKAPSADTDTDTDADTEDDLGPDFDLRVDGIEINFSEKLGAPTYRASGFLYGLSEDATLPDAHFISDIKTQFLKVGGAQLNCPDGGWVNGDYTRRWNAVSAYYEAAVRTGATLILLPQDLWGVDHVCPVEEFPGDNGDWTRFEQFMEQVIDDVIAAGMTGPNVHWDLWTEPDCCDFWEPLRSLEQYFEMWTRAVHMIREALPDAVIVGPSSSERSLGDSRWLAGFLDHVRANDVVPDILGWHQLGQSDVRDSKDTVDQWLSERGMTVDGFQVNAYGQRGTEQGPGPSAWYIGRLERLGIQGARANWAMYGSLWDTMGELVVNQNGAYHPLGAWWVYKRYADMTGTMVGAHSTETAFDAAASTDSDKANAIVVLGSRGEDGEISVSFSHLSNAAYLVEDGRVRVRLEQIPETDGVPVSEPEIVHDEMHSLNEGNWFTVEVNFENDNAHVAILGPGEI